jgi:TonB family protein
MPGILQLPSLYEREAEVRQNGAPAARQTAFKFPRPPAIAEQHLDNLFVLLDDPSSDTERDRLRWREALWMSLVIHGVAIIFLIFFMPKWVLQHAPSSLQQMLINNNLTFVELPPSPQSEKPKVTDKISDQNRVAALRHPDEKLLKELRDSNQQPAAPPPAQPPQVQQPAQQASAAQKAMQQQQQQARGTPAQPLKTSPNGDTSTEIASLPQHTGRSAASPFNIPMTAGSQIQQALKASANNRSYGSTGDVGVAPIPQPTKLGSTMDILSDTMGVDFGPYLSRVLEDIRRNWYALIPEEARPPLMKQGKVSIQFVIQKNGAVAGMRVFYPSGDAALDRAAWGGISGSNPFEPLPPEFRGDYLALRIHFYYNPSRSDLQQ